jgi:hypothetical protein
MSPIRDLLEVRDLVQKGEIPGKFELRDLFFRSVIARWTDPSLDAQYFALRTAQALHSIKSELPSVPFADVEKVAYWAGILLDTHTGGAKQTSSAPPTLYGTELYLGLLEGIGKDIPLANRQQILGLVRKCESSQGGFAEFADDRPGVVGVITTERGLSILASLNEQPQYVRQLVQFLAASWKDGDDHFLRNSSVDTTTDLMTIRYYFGAVQRLGETSQGQEFSFTTLFSTIQQHIQKAIKFIKDCKSMNAPGFSSVPDKSPSVVTTWHAIMLHETVKRLRGSLLTTDASRGVTTLLTELNELEEACSIPPQQLLTFLESEHRESGYGFCKGARPNLFALTAASRIAANIYPHLDENQQEQIKALAQKMAGHVEHFKTRNGLFRCYRD